jgi:hypothetical protein
MLIARTGQEKSVSIAHESPSNWRISEHVIAVDHQSCHPEHSRILSCLRLVSVILEHNGRDPLVCSEDSGPGRCLPLLFNGLYCPCLLVWAQCWRSLVFVDAVIHNVNVGVILR